MKNIFRKIRMIGKEFVSNYRGFDIYRNTRNNKLEIYKDFHLVEKTKTTDLFMAKHRINKYHIDKNHD